MAGCAAGALLLAGCSSDGDGGLGVESPSASSKEDGPGGSAKPSEGASPSERPAPPAKGSVKVTTTLTTKLSSPWGLAPLPGGDLLVSQRDSGEIIRVDGKSGKKTKLGTVPGVAPEGEGGLLGIAVQPGQTSLIYAYFTTESDNRVVRMAYDREQRPGNQLAAPDTIFKGIPRGTVHNGGRIAFGPDKMLYVGTGEAGEEDLSQDKDSLGGKILRMTPEGEPPGQGNPERDSTVYSWGHRNVQGFDWDREKRLWASEFGQDTWDELNLVEPGKNYGWPEAEGKADEPGFVDPVEEWKPEQASPSGLAVARGSVWMAGLRGERLWRIPLRGEKPSAKPRAFLKGKYGRLRTVVSAGGDSLWLVTSETDSRGTPGEKDDRILKLRVR
ncbi:PQQ-dependent sugar dehydrogenase [Streptomyces sp. AJS327]|uniref:PQQ-dependent sugar dehydrogenase n=1 Tax=Streptomyces sp. AJS327 TaxID=2545265 RepID=UPI0027E49E91|nr:PQQ-dependent sugar dehydrogenase [Streptomyces sp. AJS327]